jgi:hypothetical protein|eukprot:SAG25_NODE_261_length_10763_cov_3.334300_4_plen_256_part_00
MCVTPWRAVAAAASQLRGVGAATRSGSAASLAPTRRLGRGVVEVPAPCDISERSGAQKRSKSQSIQSSDYDHYVPEVVVRRPFARRPWEGRVTAHLRTTIHNMKYYHITAHCHDTPCHPASLNLAGMWLASRMWTACCCGGGGGQRAAFVHTGSSSAMKAARSYSCPGRAQSLASAPGVSTPLFHDKNTQHVGKSQSKRPHKMWKRPLTTQAVDGAHGVRVPGWDAVPPRNPAQPRAYPHMSTILINEHTGERLG